MSRLPLAHNLLPGLLVLGGMLAGCQARPDTDLDTVILAPGTISVPFRNRWWHFYERGLSWADGGDDGRAIDDFRQCLRQRQTDSRLARTYGMHFVQCFAHRELGAALLRQGTLDEAERELRLSMAHEPSAKAEHLLRQLQERRTGAVAPAPTASAVHERIEVASIVPAAGTAQLTVSGRVVLDAGSVLWSTGGTGPAIRVAADAHGSFSTEIADGATLALGTEAGPDLAKAPTVPVAIPAAAPAITLDGPDGNAVVADGCTWYRWRAQAAAGLSLLTVEDDSGLTLAKLGLSGLSSSGTLRLAVPAGRHVLRFALVDSSGGRTVTERRVDSRPAPRQDRSLRAIALAIPLQAPRPGAMRPGDDPRLMSALVEDGRFRFVDQRADGILARELAMVEAGYVDRSTAAAAGRRLSCRYVITGTMARGERDAECFVRLVHCTSGQVVASADAYAEIVASSDVDAFFAAVAGRLRQAFPVVSGQVTPSGSGQVHLAIGGRDGVVAQMRLHVFPEQTGAAAAAEVEVVEVGSDQSRATVISGSAPAAGHGVSE
jgi:hypothetical protein